MFIAEAKQHEIKSTLLLNIVTNPYRDVMEKTFVNATVYDNKR